MGSCKKVLNNIIRDNWKFRMERNVKITASFIPGSIFVQADSLSREHRAELEWKLHPKIFESIKTSFGPFDIDLFARRVNFQMKPCIHFLEP